MAAPQEETWPYTLFDSLGKLSVLALAREPNPTDSGIKRELTGHGGGSTITGTSLTKEQNEVFNKICSQAGWSENKPEKKGESGEVEHIEDISQADAQTGGSGSQ